MGLRILSGNEQIKTASVRVKNKLPSWACRFVFSFPQEFKTVPTLTTDPTSAQNEVVLVTQSCCMGCPWIGLEDREIIEFCLAAESW